MVSQYSDLEQLIKHANTSGMGLQEVYDEIGKLNAPKMNFDGPGSTSTFNPQTGIGTKQFGGRLNSEPPAGLNVGGFQSGSLPGGGGYYRNPSGATGTYGNVTPEGLRQMGFLFDGNSSASAIPTGYNPETDRYSDYMPGTYPIAGGFGFPSGALPGGNALNTLNGLGFPLPPGLTQLLQGGIGPTSNFGASAQQLGGLPIPSLQGLSRLGPSGLGILQSIFETMLGIPFNDILFASQQPFAGLFSAPEGRQRRSF